MVLVHDANRPFLKEAFLNRISDELVKISSENPCSIPVIPAVDSLIEKRQDKNLSYLKREDIFRIQTPQLLYLPSVLEAFERKKKSFADKDGWPDEGSFMLEMGFPVSTFQGDPENEKITYQEDMP